jgi:CubicO group peptidase (beta-lactamase class C family)
MFGQYIFIFPEQNTVVVRFGEMLNELRIEPLPPDVKLYLKVADHILKENQHIVKK